jgi:hypothetical protein
MGALLYHVLYQNSGAPHLYKTKASGIQRLMKELVVEDGFEPSNSKRADLQSAAFDRFATPPFPVKERITYPKF